MGHRPSAEVLVQQLVWLLVAVQELALQLVREFRDLVESAVHELGEAD